MNHNMPHEFCHNQLYETRHLNLLRQGIPMTSVCLECHLNACQSNPSPMYQFGYTLVKVKVHKDANFHLKVK
jgi:hypothetical protein